MKKHRSVQSSNRMKNGLNRLVKFILFKRVFLHLKSRAKQVNTI